MNTVMFAPLVVFRVKSEGKGKERGNKTVAPPGQWAAGSRSKGFMYEACLGQQAQSKRCPLPSTCQKLKFVSRPSLGSDT